MIASQDGMRTFLAHFLFVLAAWTLVIKYLFPLAFAVAQGAPIGAYVMWDFWWAVHIWLGWSLLHWRGYTFALALLVAIAEIAIVATKLALFLAQPVWTIWRTSWFINKLFVLACFVMLLGYLIANARRLWVRRVADPDGLIRSAGQSTSRLSKRTIAS